MTKNRKKRIVLLEGELRASLLQAYIHDPKRGGDNAIRIEEKDLQENYHKQVRVVLEVL